MVFTKRIISSSSLKKQQKSLNHRNGELSGNEPVRLHVGTRKKVAGNISHHHLDEQFGMERCLDDKECMWLSSDCTSPSSFFKEHKLSGGPFHSYADDWLISWLPTPPNSYLHLGKGNNPFNELVRSNSMKTSPDDEETFQESLKDEGGTTWSPSSTGNGEMDSFSSPISDTERSTFSVSSMNLAGEDSNRISDVESDLGHFLSGFPSPSYKSSWGYEKMNDYLSLKQASEAEDLEDFSADEPLFWPFEHEKDWSLEEAWKCFSMSPRKGLTKTITSNEKSVESTGLQFHARKINPKDGYGRKPVLSSGSTASKILELKQINNNNVAKKIERMPSRLRNSNKVSVKVVPLEMKDDHKTQPTGKKIPISKPFCMDRNLFKDDFALNEELPIELVLGLAEFDGHEGVDSDLNEDVFFLAQSL